MDIQEIKQRFGIIGNSPGLLRVIEIAVQVAPTDLSVLITGESGTGKEFFPQIIHQFSVRKHGKYVAVNCGAIPEGTIDSELFGHEKGSFTGAMSERKGYFEEADGGTIFLDEIGELPLSTQVRLLRVLEAGEFMKVGSSKALKTNVRVVAATNLNIIDAVEKGEFREDLYYRLNTVPLKVLPLRDRKEDIHLLFRKFASDFAEKYRMPTIRLDNEAVGVLLSYDWPGNVRQLKNITEQISIIEKERLIDAKTLQHYIPALNENKLPALYRGLDEKTFSSEREILYQILFDMKKDMNDLKKLVHDILQNEATVANIQDDNAQLIRKLYQSENGNYVPDQGGASRPANNSMANDDISDTEEFVEESFSLEGKEVEMIQKALDKYKGKRKYAARELGISERTLYRKIKEYDIQ